MPTSCKKQRAKPLRAGVDGLLHAKIVHGTELWLLYARLTQRANYIEWKLEAVGDVDNKAAYWLTWDVKRAKLGGNTRSRDFYLLRDGRPALFAMAEALIREAILVHGDPRQPEPGYPVDEYTAAPSPPTGRLGADVGGAGADASSPPATPAPAPPSVPPLIHGALAGRGSEPGSDLKPNGDPDEDLL